MKKLGKKLNFANQTLRAYCGCSCDNVCITKCACTSITMTTALATSNVANAYSNIGSAAK